MLEPLRSKHGPWVYIASTSSPGTTSHLMATLIKHRHIPNMSEVRQHLDFVALDDEMAFIPNHHFVLSASTVTFREPGQEVLLVRNTKYQEPFYTLPGGRKDMGEALEETAVRETYEETGYHVCLPSLSIPTRATRPRNAERRRRKDCALQDAMPTPTSSPLAQSSPLVGPASNTTRDVIDDSGTEPLGMITYSDPLAEGGSTKFRFFFYATLRDADLPPDAPLLDEEERLEAEWVTVSEALDKLRFEAERQAVETAVALTMAAALPEEGKDHGKRRAEAQRMGI